MLNIHDFNLQMVEQFFSAHQHAVGIITYFIVFCEAMAVIGVIVPGSIVMSAVGFLIGSAVIPAGSTFLWAIAGAITGDFLSYFLGIYFQDRIHRMWPFTRWPNLLTYSEKFFHNHGGKSVFLGRFVGPARAMVPMVAGMLKMPFSRFALAAIPSAAMWAVGYMVPGVLLGALSLELPAKVAAEYTFYALLVALGLWLSVWLIKHYCHQIWQMTDYYVMQSWKYCQKHERLSWIAKFLSDPKESDNHLQLMLVFLVVLLLVLFILTMHQLFISGVLVDISYVTYHLLRSIRFVVLDHIFLMITLFADLPLLLITSALVLFLLCWKKYKHVAIHWFSVVALSGGSLAIMKLFIYSPRPRDILFDKYTSSLPVAHIAIGDVLREISTLSFHNAYATLHNILHNVNSSSFPSAHCTLGMALYGFLAVIIAREIKASKRYLVYYGTGIWVAMIAFSRIYLGAHWLIDVLGGLLLGSAILLMVTISYRRKHVYHFPVRKFISSVVGIFLAVWIGYSAVGFRKHLEEYALSWPRQVITFDQLAHEESVNMPLYRLNRLGRPIEALNVMYVGDLATISQALVKQGWESWPMSLDFQEMIQSVATTSIIHHLSIFPQLYHNKMVVLLLTKSTDRDDVALILRLWSSGVDLKGSDSPLWIGTIEYHRAAPKTFSLRRFRNHLPFIGATEVLAKHLGKDFNLWNKHYSIEEQPQEMRDLQWDGRQLIIKAKGSR